jgi:uncharacterized repeat protein (TIGR01451 family)
VTATLALQDGANNLGTVAFNFVLPQKSTLANTNVIIIPDHGNASPYPSTIAVSGLAGLVSKATVTLNGFSHAFPKDVGILLVGPTGAKSVVMSGVGGGNDATNLTLVFDDAAVASLSDTALIFSGNYKPTSYPSSRTFPSPAPAGTTGASFGEFNGINPNGTWSLYVVDGVTGDGGSISQGWSLDLTTVNTINPAADLAISASVGLNPVYVGHNATYTLFVTNKGPSTATGVMLTNTLPATVSLSSVALSQGTYTTNSTSVFVNFGSLNSGEGASATIAGIPSIVGLATDTAFVSGNETDLNLVDNSVSATASVLPILPAHLSGVLSQGNHQFQITLVGQPDLSYIIQASTNLTGTSIFWKSLSTNTAAGDGSFQFTDTNAPGMPQRFYRAIVVP